MNEFLKRVTGYRRGGSDCSQSRYCGKSRMIVAKKQISIARKTLKTHEAITGPVVRKKSGECRANTAKTTHRRYECS